MWNGTHLNQDVGSQKHQCTYMVLLKSCSDQQLNLFQNAGNFSSQESTVDYIQRHQHVSVFSSKCLLHFMAWIWWDSRMKAIEISSFCFLTSSALLCSHRHCWIYGCTPVSLQSVLLYRHLHDSLQTPLTYEILVTADTNLSVFSSVCVLHVIP